MSYYNQRNYPHVPYPAKGYESATVATGGCGVCCASMIVEKLTEKSFPPPKSALCAIACGARVPGGTDMKILGKKLSADYGLALHMTDSVGDLEKALAQDAAAIVNVGGDRSGYKGVFSESGHYVAAMKLENGKIVVWDPYLYAGKFSPAYRVDKVTVRGEDVLTLSKTLDKDAENRSPRYYIFSKEKAMEPEKDNTPAAWEKEAVDWAIQRGILLGDDKGNLALHSPLTRAQFCVMLKRAAEKKDV